MSYSFALLCQFNLTCTRSFAAIQSFFVPRIVNVNVSQLTPSTHVSSSVTPPGLTNPPFQVPSHGPTGPLVPIVLGPGVGVGDGEGDVTWITTDASFVLVRPAESVTLNRAV